MIPYCSSRSTGVADGLLALGVGPAGAVGDQLGVVLAQQSADDLAQRAELVVGGVGQRGADVVAEAEVPGGRLGVVGAFGGAPPAVLLVGVPEFFVVEARAAEVGLVAGGVAGVRNLRAMEFAAGSMEPKVEAACRFAETTGGIAGIGAVGHAMAILEGRQGMRVTAAVAATAG